MHRLLYTIHVPVGVLNERSKIYQSVVNKMKRLSLILIVMLGFIIPSSRVTAGDSRSDLRDSSDTELEEAAQVDAQEYFASHRNIDTANTGKIGTAHGIHHQLLGEQLNTYEVTFFETLDALIEDKD